MWHGSSGPGRGHEETVALGEQAVRRRRYRTNGGFSRASRARGPKMSRRPDCVCEVCGARVKGRIRGNWRRAEIHPYTHKSRLDGAPRCMGAD